VETSTKSSKSPRQEASPPPTDKPKPRRFAVQPVETSAKSSRQSHDVEQKDKPKPRRFAVEPVETSQTSSKNHPSHSKFSPQPVETSYRSNRSSKDNDQPGEWNGEPEKKAPRKFSPILLDTAKRSRRSGDSTAALPQTDRTESGHHLHAREHRRHIRGDRTPVNGAEGDTHGEVSPSHNLEIPTEFRRGLSPLDGTAPNRRLSMASQRSHSFRCPELDTIESSESERGSDTSSLSSSPGQGSPLTTSDSSYNEPHKHATRVRESVDESFTTYLLQLEAKKAEERLRDQALAAFPNSDYHEPVQHYVNDDDDSEEMEIEDRPGTWEGHDDDLLTGMAARRESTAKISWEQLEMQRHAERLQEERNAAKVTAKQPSASPWWNAPTFGVGQPDNELKSMQDRARPPMLGSELVFPRCPSPEPARFDVTQGSTVLRNQMCYLTEHAESENKDDDDEGGLWHPHEADHNKPVSWIRSPAGSKQGTLNKGLWGGFCVDDGTHETSGGLAPPSQPTGLMTPRIDHHGNPFEQSFARPAVDLPTDNIIIQTPPTPPRSLRNADLGQIDGVLQAETQLDSIMDAEFPDTFITQVFNYLSLGYPALARPFDEELSKISRIPIADLRADDRKAKGAPRGYIRLGPDFEGSGGGADGKEDGVKEEGCMRWQALKLYVREWARQEGDMVSVEAGAPAGNWGTGARRGSWAI